MVTDLSQCLDTGVVLVILMSVYSRDQYFSKAVLSFLCIKLCVKWRLHTSFLWKKTDSLSSHREKLKSALFLIAKQK